MTIEAVPPSIEHQHAFLVMLADFDARDPTNAEFYAPARADFSAYVQSLLDEEHGLNLREGWVPCTHRWLVAHSGEVVGVTRLRHNIDTPFLKAHGGHIGYDVAPSQRGRGHGHIALYAALQEAANLGISSVLLYAAEDNAPSRAVIQRQGGHLESVAFSEFFDEQLCRYWVNLPQQA